MFHEEYDELLHTYNTWLVDEDLSPLIPSVAHIACNLNDPVI